MCGRTLCALAFFSTRSTVGGRISWEAELKLVVNNPTIGGTTPGLDTALRQRIQILANTRRPETAAQVQSQAQLVAVFMSVLEDASVERIRSVLAVLEDDEPAKKAESALAVAAKRLSLESRHQLIAVFEYRLLEVDIVKQHA